MNIHGATSRKHIGLNFLVIFSILISIAWIDRPLATWAYSLWLNRPMFNVSVIYRGFSVPVTLAMIFTLPAAVVSMLYIPGLVVSALTLAISGRQPRWRTAILASCMSTCVALETKEYLKWVFGRTWPTSWAGFNPSWIRDGAYGFHFFHGGVTFESFPSGHATAILSFLVPLARVYPRFRSTAVICCLATAIGLVAGDYHFLSDVIAGGYLGVTIGVLCSRLILRD